jgi:hypothetical protein
MRKLAPTCTCCALATAAIISATATPTQARNRNDVLVVNRCSHAVRFHVERTIENGTRDMTGDYTFDPGEVDWLEERTGEYLFHFSGDELKVYASSAWSTEVSGGNTGITFCP